MPIYEFYSPDTHKIYTFFARSSAYADRTPRCPDGKDHAMRKLISGFSVTGAGSKDEEQRLDAPVEGGDDPFAGMNESQMNAAMHELEKTVGSMDEENPDPRQMGQLMRKMAEMTGDKLDEGMEEVVRKLEEGADPDELEDRLGDIMEDGGDFDDHPDLKPGEKEAVSGRGRRTKRPQPSRDPEMYEMVDFL